MFGPDQKQRMLQMGAELPDHCVSEGLPGMFALPAGLPLRN
jgi:hypothetical protein